MAKVGIGIVTYNRLPHLQRALAAVRRHTRSPHNLVVAEDGGDDGTREWCAQEGVHVVTGANSGVCWNKNRALFALQAAGCDPILLLEDDCLPYQDHWEQDWRVATALFGHLAFAHSKLDRWLISGAGTPTDPFVNNKATAQCSSVSAEALLDVGYFDTRFRGYGVGHAEWTTRLKRAGYGWKAAVDAEGQQVKANLYIKGGLVADDAPTFKDRANIERNEALFDSLKSEPVYRHPWSDDAEKERFLGEVAAAGVKSRYYDRLSKDARADLRMLTMRHVPAYRMAMQQAFDEPRSFVRSSAWLRSIATDLPAYRGEMAPPLNYTAIDLLAERVQPHWRVFVYGADYGAFWWAGKVAEVIAVGTDAREGARLARLNGEGLITLRHISDDQPYPASIREEAGLFDLVVVAGRDRPACVRAGASRLTDAGVLVLAESDRSGIAEMTRGLAANGFKELRLRGPAPRTPGLQSTSFFYRAANVLGL